MARARTRTDGQLEESLAALVRAQTNMLQALANLAQNETALMQNQTALMQTQTALIARMAQLEADIAATNRLNAERFARIEALLAEHGQVLAALPEAVHRRFGFRPPEPPSG